MATSSRLGAEAGVRIAENGGNAVDAAAASLLVSLVTEPGISSIGGGGFFTVRPPGGTAVTVDGQVVMPGKAAPGERFGQGGVPVELGYGGGVETVVGPGSVAVPGVLAALERTWEEFGRVGWAELFGPAVEFAREGFALSAASRHWLEYSHRAVFGREAGCRDPIHRPDGSLKAEGETVRLPRLAETLERVAEDGAEAFYRGELGRRIADHVRGEGGLLTVEDLEEYRPVVRESLGVELDDALVATNPPPAVGGAVLGAMLRLARDGPPSRRAGIGTPEGLRRLARVQEAVFRFAEERAGGEEGLTSAARELLEPAGRETLRRRLSSPSTVHVSAVDGSGLACSVSASSGYGAGVVPPGTGVWLNNCLGERELNRRGFHALEPGTRVPSNMAPTVVREPEYGTVALGSPGASRITSALTTTLIALFDEGLSLEEAVAHPRLHVELGEAGEARAACEPGLPVGELGLPTRVFEERSMYFGGVTAALRRPGGGLRAAADPRREGGTAVSGR